ncbi:DUF2617 family protein [Mariniluteicoccus flavus]
MELTAGVPFVDACVGDLGFSVGDGPELAALAELEVDGIVLRVLGASHQVVLPGGLTETLACAEGLPRVPLPHRRDDRLSVGGRAVAYAMEAERVAGAGAELAERARVSTEAYADHLCVRFAGDPHALTALGARRTDLGWEWETWHVYPQHREAVRSRTTVTAGGHA